MTHTTFRTQKLIPTQKNTSYYLNKVDGKVDGLLAGTDVVGNDIRHKGVF